MEPGHGWNRVDLGEVLGSALISLGVGMIRLLIFIRDHRRVHWVNMILEPSMAVFGGMVFWAMAEHWQWPDLIQAVGTSIGAWGGPRTIHWAERRFLGGSRRFDSSEKEKEEDYGTRP